MADFKIGTNLMCPGCGKEHDKGELVGRIIDDSYNIKCLFSSCEKEIKINASPKIEESIPTTPNNYDDTAKWGETYYYDDETDDWSTPYEDKDRGYYLNLDTREIRRKETVVF